MISRIVVGTGAKRVSIALPSAREARYSLGNKLKGALFPTNAAFKAAKQRGASA